MATLFQLPSHQTSNLSSPKSSKEFKTIWQHILFFCQTRLLSGTLSGPCTDFKSPTDNKLAHFWHSVLIHFRSLTTNLPLLTLCAHWFQITNNLLLSDTLCSLVSNQWQLAPFWHSVLTASLAHKSLHASCKLHGQCSGAVYCFFVVVVFPLYYNIFLVQI